MVFIRVIIYLIKKGWAYIINLNKYADVGTHSIALYVLNNEAVYLTVLVFNTFLKKLGILKVISIVKPTFIIQAYDLIMWGYFCIGFIDH